MEVPVGVLSFIRAHERFLILGHKEPDGDCIASQVTVCRLVEALGKTGKLFSAGPFDRPEIVPFEGMFSGNVGDGDLEGGPAVIVVDCSTPDRTGDIGMRIKGLPCLVVDHHSSGEVFGDERFVNIASPSTTMLVFAMFDAAAVTPTPELARLILFGLCTDTGFFRHLGASAARYFRQVARLVELGTSTAEVFQMIYGKRDLVSRKLLGAMLQRTEGYAGDRLLVTWQTQEERSMRRAYIRGEDELYRLLQTVKGNLVVVFIKEESKGGYSVGLRSTSAIDVGEVARSFGGGGHKQAAGCDITGTLEYIKQVMIEKFLPLVQESDAKS